MDERDTSDREDVPEETDEQQDPYSMSEDDEQERGTRRRLDADFLLDKVIPTEIDWRDLVRRHPFVSVGLAAGLGFLIGRSKGSAIVAGASAALTGAAMRQLSDVLDGEIFEF